MAIHEAYALEQDACRRARGALDEALAAKIGAPGGTAREYHFGMVYVAPLGASPERLEQAKTVARQIMVDARIENADYRGAVPLLTGKATGAQLLKIAFATPVLSITEDGPGNGVVESDAVMGYPEHVSQAAPTFLIPGTASGAGERIGVIDPGGCLIRDSHTMFLHSAVEYQQPGLSQTCTSDTDCWNACEGGAATSKSYCRGGKCIDGHGTWVSSVVAQVAPFAKILYTNGNFRNNLAPLSEMQAAYSWLAQQNARFVVQSFRAVEQYDRNTGRNSSQGITEDLYARRNGWFIAQSAGNNGNTPLYSGTADGGTDGGTPIRDPKREACPWSMNTLCVGSHRLDLSPSCFSSWQNPGHYNMDVTNPDLFTDRDREEPDILAFGGNANSGAFRPAFCTDSSAEQVYVASTSSDTNPDIGAIGTSFSAPTAAAGAALVHEYCASKGIYLDGLKLRNVLMLSATRNAIDWKYSTLKSGRDAVDGAGDLSLEAAKRACDSLANIPQSDPGPVAVGGDGVVDSSVPGEKMPPGEVGFPGAPPGALPANQGLTPNVASSAPGISSTVLYEWQKRAGEHIRFVLSWNACADTAAAPNKVGMDLDVFLYNKTLRRYLYASQSNDDNNEGFDVEIPVGWDGLYQVYLVHADRAPGCADSPKLEPYRWTAYK